LLTLAESSISLQAGHRDRAAEPLAKPSNEAIKIVGEFAKREVSRVGELLFQLPPATMNSFGDVDAELQCVPNVPQTRGIVRKPPIRSLAARRYGPHTRAVTYM